jgi:hypothetical protein
VALVALRPELPRGDWKSPAQWGPPFDPAPRNASATRRLEVAGTASEVRCAVFGPWNLTMNLVAADVSPLRFTFNPNRIAERNERGRKEGCWPFQRSWRNILTRIAEVLLSLSFSSVSFGQIRKSVSSQLRSLRNRRKRRNGVSDTGGELSKVRVKTGGAATDVYWGLAVRASSLACHSAALSGFSNSL